MSILKSILHRWNKDSNSYDTLHPETEVAQITDWSQGIVNTLASTALGSLISTLSSDSLMAKLMKLVLDASGVKYLIDTNGYVCFGSLFGGLIIQWGHLTANNSTGKIILPISANAVVCILQHYGVSPQYNGIDNSGVVYSSFKEEEEIRFIAITK